MLFVALAVGTGACSGDRAGSSDKETVTILTSGSFETGKVLERTIVTVNFSSVPGTQEKHVVSGPLRYVTDGVVVSKGATMEFLSLAEAKARFKELEGTSALCTLDFDGSAHSCKSDECQGKCALHKNPEYC